MDELTSILQQATAGPVYPERVYCNELYHQMRMLWPKTTPFYLNGEIDNVRNLARQRCSTDESSTTEAPAPRRCALRMAHVHLRLYFV